MEWEGRGCGGVGGLGGRGGGGGGGRGGVADDCSVWYARDACVRASVHCSLTYRTALEFHLYRSF